MISFCVYQKRRRFLRQRHKYKLHIQAWKVSHHMWGPRH